MMIAIQRFVRRGWRQLTLFSSMGLFALLIAHNLVHWQVEEHQALAQVSQQTYDQLVPDPAPRGSILDNTGTPLVTSDLAYTLHADPSVLVKGRGARDTGMRDAAVATLMPILHMDRATLTRLLTYQPSKPGAQYVLLADGLGDDAAEALRKLDWGWLTLDQHPRAYYLNGSLAAPLLGFVNAQGVGQYGIEGAYDTVLRGRDGARLNLAAAAVHPLPAGVRPQPYVPGADVELTINTAIQQIVEKRLQEAVTHSRASGGAAVVMDPKTGAILAMASVPSYDPNHYGDYSNTPSLYDNLAIQDYTPGSTFKVFSVATGFDTGSFDPTTKVYDPGFYQDPQGIDVIHNWDLQRGWGWETPEIMLRHSANVGMVQFAEMIKPPMTFYNYLIDHFGFTKPTGIGLGEEPGLVRTPEGRAPWQWMDFLRNSFGQSIEVTPLQMVTAMAALANGGTRMRPYVVQSIRYPNGHVDQFGPKVAAQAVTPSTAATMADVLHRSGLSDDGANPNPSDQYGSSEATCALTDGFPAAVKTGTASTEVAAYTTDTSGGTIASLLGYAPLDNPRFAMLVVVYHPRRLPTDTDANSHIYGAITAAPAWHDIAERLYGLMGIQSRHDPLADNVFKENIPQVQGPQGWNCEFDKPNGP